MSDDVIKAFSRLNDLLGSFVPENERTDQADRDWHLVYEAVKQAARQAPASGEVEPVAEVITSEFERLDSINPDRVKDIDWLDNIDADQFPDGTKLYTHPPAKVPENVLEAWHSIESYFRGSVIEGADTLKLVHRFLTNPAPATTAETEWVKPSEDLPSENGRDPVWYWDNHQGMMLISSHEAYRRLLRSEAHNPHWMPTGLKRPTPPQEQ